MSETSDLVVTQSDRLLRKIDVNTKKTDNTDEINPARFKSMLHTKRESASDKDQKTREVILEEHMAK